MPILDEICAIKDGPVQYKRTNKGICMANHEMPVSIADAEWDFLSGFISQHGLKRGFEVATAFGVSACAIGTGLKETGGRLVTMDAYIEEQYNDCSQYRAVEDIVNEGSDGLASAIHLICHFDLTDVVTPTIGWSPTDTADVIRSVHGDEKLDFAFVDALHYDEAVIRDIEAIRPFLAPSHILFLHDVHCFGDPVKDYITNTFGKMWETPASCVYRPGVPGGGYNLSYVNNLG